MLDQYLEVYTLSVVIVGDFNPVIVQPSWLAHKELIRNVEAEKAKIEIIHNDITRFEIDWAKIEITQNRFQIRTSEEDCFEPLKDLILSIFEILRETPIRALGINHLKYYALPEEELYFNIGNKLAPLNNWNEVLNDPRMLGIEIIELERKDKLKGQVRVRVQPSDIKLSSKYGVLFSVNDHFDIESEQNPRDGTLVKILGTKLNSSIQRAKEISETIWNKIK